MEKNGKMVINREGACVEMLDYCRVGNAAPQFFFFLKMRSASSSPPPPPFFLYQISRERGKKKLGEDEDVVCGCDLLRIDPVFRLMTNAVLEKEIF